MMFNWILQRELDKLSNDGELSIKVQSKCIEGNIQTKWIELPISTEELFEALSYAYENRANIWEVA